MSDETKPRFSFEMTEEQRIRSIKLLGNYGLRKAIFSKILDDVLDMVESHGGMALGILMSEKVKPREIISSMVEVSQVIDKIKGGQDG